MAKPSRYVAVSPAQRAGSLAEAQALDYLRSRGLRLIEANVRLRCGEIDLIMAHQGHCVFVEVRQRSSARFGGAAASVGARKQARVRAAAARLFQPLVIYGMNALFIFALSGFIAKMMGFIKIPVAAAEAAGLAGAAGTNMQAPASISLKTWLYAPLKALPLEPVQASLLWALLFNAVMFIVAWAMWKKRWFIKA